MEKEKKMLLSLNQGRNVYVYEGEDTDFIQSSNVPFFDVEDQKNWKCYKVSDGNPNLIGQIHLMNDGVKFHLCYDCIGSNPMVVLWKCCFYPYNSQPL